MFKPEEEIYLCTEHTFNILVNKNKNKSTPSCMKSKFAPLLFMRDRYLELDITSFPMRSLKLFFSEKMVKIQIFPLKRRVWEA